MKKFTAISISILLLFFSLSTNVFAKENIKKDVLNDFIVTLLGPNLIGAVNEYYGEPRELQLSNAKIVNIKRIEEGSLYFIVTVRMKTSNKSNKSNKCCGIDTITLTNTNEGIQIIDFTHEDEPITKSL